MSKRDVRLDGSGGATPAPSNVFLVPVDPGNFERTVASPVDLSEHPDSPDGLPTEGEVRFWGVRDGKRNRQQFERMAPGDVVLFYRDGTYVGIGRVGAKVEDDGWASETFWDGAPAERLYTVTDYRAISVPRAAVNRIFDYGPDYTPQGLFGVADGRLPDSIEAFEAAILRYDEKHG